MEASALPILVSSHPAVDYVVCGLATIVVAAVAWLSAPFLATRVLGGVRQ